MSKPILDVEVSSLDDKSSKATAVFDTGSFYTIIRRNKLPKGSPFLKSRKRKYLKTAGKGGRLTVVGATVLRIRIRRRIIRTEVLVSPNLSQEMLIGAGTMQAWDISIQNKNGKTEVNIGHDLRDPQIQQVD